MEERQERRHGRIVAAFAVLAVVLRAPALLYPVLGEEEATESAVAAVAVQGGDVYRDAAAGEAPLGYWLTAGLYGLFGNYAQRSAHAVALVAVLGAMAALAFAARALGGDRAVPIAALFYAVFSVAQPPAALGANAELWMALCLSLSAWFLLGGVPTRRFGAVFLAGSFAAAGALFRHAAVAFVAPALLYPLVARPLLLGRARLGEGALAALSFALGFAVAYAVALGYLGSRDALDAFARSAWASRGVAGTWLDVLLAVAGPGILWLMAGRAVRDVLRAGGPRRELDAAVALVAGWLLAAALAILARGRAGASDFLALVPPLVLLAAAGTAAIGDEFWSGKLARVFRLGIAIPAGLFFCAGLFHEPLYRGLGLAPVKVRPIAAAVRERTTGSDRIWVLGEARRVYVYARRAPPAQGLAAAEAGRRATLPAAVAASPPALVVDAGGDRSQELSRWLERRYVLESVVEGVRLLRRKTP